MSVPLGILLSGSGSTYENLAQACGDGRLDAEIVQVISSRAGVGGLEKAERHGHARQVLRDPEAITAAMQAAGAEYIAMCGFMRYYDPPACYRQRVTNIHPSLLPAFGGNGMYGQRVHAAVLAAGCRISGCSVHLVCGDYDSGPILGQRSVSVTSDDTPTSLGQRVQAAERALYPEVLQALFSGELRQNAHGAWWIES